jgi:hypothetical protein
VATDADLSLVPLITAQRRFEFYEDHAAHNDIYRAFEDAGIEELNYEERRHAFEDAVEAAHMAGPQVV